MDNLLLSEDKSKLLTRLLEREGYRVQKQNTIPHRASPEYFPLSYTQQRLWFLYQMAPNSPHYNIPMPLRLIGELDVKLLQKCLTEIMNRHEVLRATFQDISGQPVQRISSVQEMILECINFENQEVNNSDVKIQRLITEDAGAPFDLSRDCLFRARLLKVNSKENVLSITFHHIIADGTCQRIFLNELVTLYDQGSRQLEFKLPELPIKFADFAEWQQQRLQENKLEEDLNYWLEQLKNAPSQLSLPTDYPRPSQQSFKGGQSSQLLSSELTQQLNSLSREQGVTLFTTLLTAFKVLLYRYSGQQDIVVGSPVVNRSYPETESLIGPFINTIALRTVLNPDQSFTKLLTTVSRNVLSGFEHQEYPFEKLVDALQVQRHKSHAPLFQVMFNYQPTLENELAMDVGSVGLRISPMQQPGGIAKFDLTLHVEQKHDGLGLVMDYPVSLYKQSTIERMLGHYQSILKALVTNPRQSIGDLTLITPAEQDRILCQWSIGESSAEIEADRHCKYKKPSSSAKNLNELFELRVKENPGHKALIYNDQQLTYQQLNEKSETLASNLHQQGVNSDSLVCVCMERSFDMIISILGVLKAGAAYVPIDPEYPPERIQYILDDSGASVLLSQSQLLELTALQEVFANYRSIDNRKIIAVDKDLEDCSKPQQRFKNKVDNHSLAYVIYTSGSTGKPKGTLIEHRSVVRICSETNYIDIRPDDKLLQLSNFAFDGSIFDIFGALLNGASLVLIDHCDILDIDKLSKRIEENKVSVFFITTALFNLLVDHSPTCLQGVRKILFGGEKVSVPHVNKALDFVASDSLIHVYGPTESTVFASFYPLVEPRYLNNIAIGKPVTDTQLYVLDKRQHIQPIGIPGELTIGGSGLARSYLNQDTLSSEKFVDNPYQPGTRMYKTGDLVKWSEDGNIDFLGRIDHQIKVRGFRIELGEIEAVLNEQCKVREAVVLSKTINNSTKLIAYYIPEAGQEKSTSKELRDTLLKKLPEVMVPSAFIALDAFPLTQNGKVDRNNLLQQEIELQGSKQYRAPRNPIEQVVSDIFAEILGVERCGIRDDFFALGGHSLLVTQILARVNDQFNSRMGLQEFFNQPNVEHVAGLIQQQQHQSDTCNRIEKIKVDDDSGIVNLDLDQLSNSQVDQLLNSFEEE